MPRRDRPRDDDPEPTPPPPPASVSPARPPLEDSVLNQAPHEAGDNG